MKVSNENKGRTWKEKSKAAPCLQNIVVPFP